MMYTQVVGGNNYGVEMNGKGGGNMAYNRRKNRRWDIMDVKPSFAHLQI